MKNDKDLVMRYVDWCDGQGALGGIYFIGGFTIFTVLFSVLLITLGLVLLGALA